MLIDTHAHLDQEEFDADRESVVERAVAAGVETIVTIGTTGASSRANWELTVGRPRIRCAVGIQPNYVSQAEPGDWDAIVELATRPGVVALGETGLDRYWDHSPFDAQRDYFDRHLRLSQATGLPFVVHMRDCDEDILEMLRAARTRGALNGVMHSFTGRADTAAECVSLGLYISFAGMVTFPKSGALREIGASVPDARILIETDSPYLSPAPLRGRRNEPAHLTHTAKCLATARGATFEAFAALTTANARALFRLA